MVRRWERTLSTSFKSHMRDKYTFPPTNSAKGIDFPEFDVDIKVTSIKQPQSSCSFKSARQKIFGLGYSLLVFVVMKVAIFIRASTSVLASPLCEATW